MEKLTPGDTHVDWVVRNRHHRLKLRIQRSKSFSVYAPTRNDMSGRVAETMDAKIELQFFALERGQERLILEDSGRNAGLEVVGDIDRLLGLWDRV